MAVPSSNFVVDSEYLQIINGLGVSTAETRWGINPTNKEPLSPVPVATKQNLDDAVVAGNAAFEIWSTKPYEQRKSAVLSYADALEAYRQKFEELLSLETGKVRVEVSLEMHVSLEWLRGLASIPLPEDTLLDSETRTIITRHVPIGVVTALIPWNSPIMLAAVKIALAVLTGNVIIVKPSPFTPYSGLKLVELAQSYFPAGVVQSLSGDESLGPWMSAHPGIDMISLTGSINSGKRAMESASKTLKRLTLELGGNDSAIIFPDVDINQVAEKIASLAFLTAGQICVAIKRIYVHASIYPAFRAAIVEAVQKLKIGPVQNKMQFDYVKSFFEDIKEQNWNVAVGGEIEESSGYFIPRTIIDLPPEDSRIVSEEQFGPIVPLLVWNDEEDVITRANNTNTGLGASIWTKNLEKADETARKINVGNVWVNDHCNFNPMAPFGGHKQSGLGSEGGLHGLKHHCNIQVLNINKV